MKILITGVGGFIGFSFPNYLLNKKKLLMFMELIIMMIIIISF